MKVSVVILVLNGGPILRRSVASLLSQKSAEQLEILLLDSGSTDGSESLCEEFPVRLESIAAAEFRFGYARNLAFGMAHGDYIATISQDYIPGDNGWLDRLIAPIRNGADVALGRGIPHPDRRPFFWETRRFAFTRESRKFIDDHGGHGFSCMCLATRRDVWEATGFGDDVLMGEDKYFQRECFENGYRRVEYVAAASGYHGHKFTVRSLFRRCENEGFGWQFVDVEYPFSAMLLDLLAPTSYAKLVLALARFQIRTAAEALFIWLRPIAVYKGNRFNREYVR